VVVTFEGSSCTTSPELKTGYHHRRTVDRALEGWAVTVSDGQVDRGTFLGKQIAEALRREIVLGIIPSGTKLSQRQLCEKFGTSRMPVRDGLKLLSHEGLVTTDATQHSIVAPLSRADLLDAYLIEGTLTGLAAERASRNATDDDIAELQKLHEAMVEFAAESDHQRMAELNWTFHRRINRLSRSRKLLSAIKITSLDLPRDFLAEMPEWSPDSNVEHAKILKAMSKRRHADVGRLMREHIINSGNELVASLIARGTQLD
jgi:DNA-binding GntR family transcriptional regulator